MLDQYRLFSMEIVWKMKKKIKKITICLNSVTEITIPIDIFRIFIILSMESCKLFCIRNHFKTNQTHQFEFKKEKNTSILILEEKPHQNWKKITSKLILEEKPQQDWFPNDLREKTTSKSILKKNMSEFSEKVLNNSKNS